MFLWHLLLLVYVTSGEEISDEEHKLLPKKFNLNNNFKCEENSKYFSKILVKLESKLKKPSKVWKVIEKAENDERRFSYKSVKFGYCLDKNENLAKFVKNAENNISKLYDNMGLNSQIEYIKFYDLMEEKDFIDYLLVLIIIGLLLFVLYATMQHKINKNNVNFPKNHPILNAFSLFTSFKSATKETRGSEYENLNHLEGLRTVVTYLVLIYHVHLALCTGFFSNPDFVEQLNHISVVRFLLRFAGFMLTPFVTLSGFVLGMQLYTIIEMKQKLTFRRVVVFILNRFLRFLPLVVFVVLLHASKFSMVENSSPLNKFVAIDQHDMCRVNWWKTILFLQTIKHTPGMCAVHTWSVATDLYLYILGITLVYLSLKLHLNTLRCLIITGLVSSIYQGYSIYKLNNVQGFVGFEPKFDSIDWFDTEHFWLCHVSITQHAVTFIVGLIFGKAYVQYKKNEEFIKKWRGNGYVFKIVGLVVFAVISTEFKYSLIGNYVCVLIGKFFFALAMVIWFLGMSTNPTSKTRKFFGSKVLVFLGKFSFSLYIINFCLVIANFTKMDGLVTISFTLGLTSSVHMIVLCTLASIVLYVLLENPCAELQKLLKKKLEPKGKST